MNCLFVATLLCIRIPSAFLRSTFPQFMLIPNWLIGILLALLSTSLGSLGKVMIRCVHLLNVSEGYPGYLRSAWRRFPIVASFLISSALTRILTP